MLREILNFEIIINSETEPNFLNYTTKLLNWTTEWMSIQLDFESPLLVSKGLIKDMLQIKVLDMNMFRSQESRDILLEENSLIKAFIPKQLIKGLKEETL